MNKAPTEQILPKVYLESLGCFKNTYDSEIVLHSLLKNGYALSPDPAGADVLIVNTCAFLTASVKESIERIVALSEFKKKSLVTNPLKQVPLLVVIGCLVERQKEELLKEIPEIDALLGTSDYTKILPLINDCLALKENSMRAATNQVIAESFKGRPKYVWDDLPSSPLAINFKHLRFLKVAEGCSNQCSFCNIPKLRGKQSSRPVAAVAREFKQFLDWGVKEINIISQNSSSYGFDLNNENANLLKLTERLLKDGQGYDYWLRIFYSYPNDYPTELFSLMHDSPLIPYIDMPFQHISNQVLKRMNRRITAAEIYTLLDQAKKELGEKISIRTTFIVGFPGETEADFEELHNFVKQGYFQHIGVFCYSDEDNIPSHRFADSVPLATKKKRQKILMQTQEKITEQRNLALVNSIQRVIIDQSLPRKLVGRYSGQAIEVDGVVILDKTEDIQQGQFVNAQIQKVDGYDLVGKVALGAKVS